MVAVRDAREDELDRVVALLDLAFADDPFVGWLTRRRADARRRYVELVTRRLIAPRGRVLVTDDLQATALWMPPGGWQLPLRTQLGMLWPLTRVVGASRLFEIARVSAAIEEGRPDAHWYLALVGTSPEARGRGLGAAVVNAGLDLARSDDVPALLETSNQKNVGWYERFGFEVRRRLDPPPDAPPVWTLAA
ncbi:MAG: GNAT family N-acetyltransferase [Sandaracinus sp.]|nr:GNAT family N-acetyltransferase [Sandaracinus sp.]MCB9618670.1 GNAT family N-acetyltransferase [Sandaracinus sp.]